MGVMTLAGFRSELLFALKNRSDTTSPEGFTTARQDAMINFAYQHVSHPSIHRHRELQTDFTLTLVNGQYNYIFTGLPVTGRTIQLYSVSHVAAATDDPTSTRTKLLPHDRQWFQNRTLNSGRPRDYCIRGSEILVSPIPGTNEAGQVLVVSAYREPASLSAVGDVTVLESRWDEVILLGARWRSELQLGYRDLAEGTKMDYVGMINEFREFDQLHGEDWNWSTDIARDGYMETV